MRTRVRKTGFTLVEMLVVMAIAAILMGLVMGPVVQSLNLTRRAQAMADAQDAARTAMNQISRELGQAMYVYDNAPAPIELFDDGTTNITIYEGSTGMGQMPIMLPVRQPSGSIQGMPLPYAKIDFYLPKIIMHCNAPEKKDDGSGQHPAGDSRDYPRGDEAWPPCPICHSDDVEARPKLPLEQDATIVRYFLALRNNDPDDPQFGWRSPWDAATAVGEGNQVVLYRAEFSIYDDQLFPSKMTVEERMVDPIFFYRKAENSQHVRFCDRWQQISRVVGLGKYEDLVEATRDDNNNITSVKPSITFRTSAIDNDTFAGAYSSDRSFEYPDAVPTVFRSTYGYWTPDYRVTLYRDDYNIAFSTGYDDETGDLIIWKSVHNPADDTWDQTKHFNISEYLATGAIVNMHDATQPVEMAFTFDLGREDVYGLSDAQCRAVAPIANRGAVNFALQPLRPHGSAPTGPVFSLNPEEIKAINDNYIQQYRQNRVAIRCLRLYTFDKVNHSDQYLENARVVPGSEQVIGPDMTPNADPNKPVRYERVPLALGDPGLNQFKIDYDNGWIYFSPVWDQPLPENGCSMQFFYKIQFNRKDDIVRGDYSTKSLISIHMQMRMFDPESGTPYPVDLSDSVKVRNALR